MEFLNNLKEKLFGKPGGRNRDPNGIYFYVVCDKCGTPLRIRADKRHDIQRDYKTGEYILRKEMMDNSYFNLMQATLRFNASYNIVDREIEGGQFITQEEYESLQSPTDTENAEADVGVKQEDH